MGKISGKPGPDSDADIAEAGEQPMMMENPAAYWTLDPVKVFADDLDALEVMYKAKKEMAKVDINLNVRDVEWDWEPDGSEERLLKKSGLNRVPLADVVDYIRLHPGLPANVLAHNLYLRDGVATTTKQRQASMSNFRVAISRLTRSGKVKRRFDGANIVFFAREQETYLPKTRGGDFHAVDAPDPFRVAKAIAWAKKELPRTGFIPVHSQEKMIEFAEALIRGYEATYVENNKDPRLDDEENKIERC